MADIFADDFSLGSCEGVNPESEEQPNPFSFSTFVGASGLSTSVEASTSNSTCDPHDTQTGGDDLNPYSFQNFTTYSVGNRKPGRKLQIIDDEDDSSSSSNEILPSNQPCKSEDDKFTGIRDDTGLLDHSYDSDSNSEESEQLMKIEKLSKENMSLRNDLAKVRDEFLEYRRTANKRVTGLQKELEKVRKKEAEETRDLDNVVQMVEENLQKTTTRATNAEATVAKLKEEVRSLRESGVSREQYDALVLEHNQLLSTVQEKSRNVAQLMRTAAEKTEPHVKQLQSGMASLRFFAQQFDDICKVTELTERKTSRDHVT